MIVIDRSLINFFANRDNVCLFHSDGNFPFLKHYLKIILSVLQIKGPHIFNMRILFMSCLLVLFSCGLSIKIS